MHWLFSAMAVVLVVAMNGSPVAGQTRAFHPTATRAKDSDPAVKANQQTLLAASRNGVRGQNMRELATALKADTGLADEIMGGLNRGLRNEELVQFIQNTIADRKQRKSSRSDARSTTRGPAEKAPTSPVTKLGFPGMSPGMSPRPGMNPAMNMNPGMNNPAMSMSNPAMNNPAMSMKNPAMTMNPGMKPGPDLGNTGKTGTNPIGPRAATTPNSGSRSDAALPATQNTNAKVSDRRAAAGAATKELLR